MAPYLTTLIFAFCTFESVTSVIAHDTRDVKYNLRPFQIDLSNRVPRMLDLVRNTKLPPAPEYPGVGSTAGMALNVLENMKNEWLTGYDWDKEQAVMNGFNQHLVEVEGQTIHFLYEKSKEKDAIPLLLAHGWPGSFIEFMPVIKNLTEAAKTSNGKSVSFDVVVPSLPGFAFSSPAPADWSNNDTGRIWNTLMTDVLGYDKYAVHGTDWGAAPTYFMYSRYNETVRAAYFNFLPFFPLPPAQLKAENITLESSLTKFEERHAQAWSSTGDGYFIEQTTKPNTIGLALYDNPIGQLAWIGEKFIAWSDPRQGTPPSVLTHKSILTSVSLYYLTRSFISAEYIYYQNPNGFMTEYSRADTDAPMLFAAFKYNIAFWPRRLVEKVGNLTMYTNHEFGGHFAGLDNPPALISDLREIGTYWSG